MTSELFVELFSTLVVHRYNRIQSVSGNNVREPSTLMSPEGRYLCCHATHWYVIHVEG